MIDTITFDLWNTLISTSPIDNFKFKNKRIEGFIQILKEERIFSTREKMEQAYDQSFEIYKTIQDGEKDISTREQVEIILKCLKNPEVKKLEEVVLSKLDRVLATQILTDPPELIKGSQEILSYLKDGDYKIGLICNTGRSPGKTLREVLKIRNIAHFFDRFTFSDEQRIRKPNPKIFFSTLEALQSTPSASLHLGDELKSDVLGARRCGMKSAWFKPDWDGHQINFPPEQKPDFILQDLVSLKKVLE